MTLNLASFGGPLNALYDNHHDNNQNEKTAANIQVLAPGIRGCVGMEHLAMGTDLDSCLHMVLGVCSWAPVGGEDCSLPGPRVPGLG